MNFKNRLRKETECQVGSRSPPYYCVNGNIVKNKKKENKMNFKELKLQIKEEQKELAKRIKRGKFLAKPKNWNLMDEKEKSDYIYETSNGCKCFLDWKVGVIGWNYRNIHIAYCEFFNNTSYEKIENPRKYNKPDRKKIDGLKVSWKEEINEETLRYCA